MGIENILLVGRNDWAKFDQLRDLGCRVSQAESLSAAEEELACCELVVVEARALQSQADTSWLADGPSRKPVLFVTGDRQNTDAISSEALRNIFGFVSQAPTSGELAIMLQSASALQRIIAINARNTAMSGNAELIGSSPAANGLRETIRKIARTQATVLIQGEKGTSKTAVAATLHQQSSRAAQPLCPVDCATLDPDATELFGADTGAKAAGEGFLELADRGTLILEEISALSAAAQQKLLQFLHEGVFNRAGGSSTIRSDARIIATTSMDLLAKCKGGAFREDLFLRLNIAPIRISPLRERQADIPELSEHFRRQLSTRYESGVVAFSPAASKAMLGYTWPGNIAELEHVIGRAVIVAARKSVIEPEHLRIEAGYSSTQCSHEDGTVQTLDDVERQHIFYVLDQCQWNRTHAAVKLGISIRTLRNKLREYRSPNTEDTQQEAA